MYANLLALPLLRIFGRFAPAFAQRCCVRTAVGLTAALLLAGGCSTPTPVGVTWAGRNGAYAQVDCSVLNSFQFSSATAAVLHRYDLERMQERDPLGCLIRLHHIACQDTRRDTLFALSEIAFLLGKADCRLEADGRKLAAENFFAASAVYAYLYLMGPGEETAPDAFDRRFRMACDFFNRSLGYIIVRRENIKINTDTFTLELPVGSILIHRGGADSDFNLLLRAHENYVLADSYTVRGLSVRNRVAGIGAPIVIEREKKVAGELVVCSAATAFLRVHGNLADMAKGAMSGNVEVYSAFTRESIEVEGCKIPLERDLTTQIAYSLNSPAYWKIDQMLFRLGEASVVPGIYPSQPYKAGKIPILFVHGTMSSPVWWAEMWNTLMGDPLLREKCQFWFYLYDSAKPIVQSAAQFRESIETTVNTMDPDGKDPMLRQMVVIGHSQGGLLTKLTATDTGEALILAATGKSLAELNLTPEDEKLVRRLAIFKPLPEVKRVVFIATPHRGSYRVGGIVRYLAHTFLTLPKQALQTSAELLRFAPKVAPDVKLASTSLDSMSPDNPAMLALAEIPVAPPIKAHSIIAIDGDEVPPAGDDGVVKYASAHITGVASEVIVRSPHSCQGNPVTIEEVRRILLEHLRQVAQ